MKALVVDRYGKTSRLRAGEMPGPEMREDEVLVQVHAAGVNLLDSKIRDGEFKLVLPYRLPLILGHDVALAGRFTQNDRNVIVEMVGVANADRVH